MRKYNKRLRSSSLQVACMKCERCGNELQENEANNCQGKLLCEDCTFDLLNPPKTCDPTAVSSTLTVRKQLGQTGTQGLSELQKKIYDLVVAQGKISREDLIETLDLTLPVFEREFAVLLHCELLRAFKEDGTIYFAKY
jgi:late competence protein required for DNA uptake (superfamily II DNA/RNA helicase)